MRLAAMTTAGIATGNVFRNTAQATQPNKRPNILMILTDDQGWGDICSHGNPVIETPTMDKLANEGVRFELFFVSPVCAPTRASLLTGRYHLRTGTNGVTRGWENMRTEEVTIAEILKEHDYVTGCFGKWHNGSNWPYHPNAQGFDEFVGFCRGHLNNYFDARLERNGEFFQSKGYISDVLTDHAIKFIEKNKTKPFFCYIPYNAPHGPYQVPDRYFTKYKAKGLADDLACVYAMCENLDDNLSRLLMKLNELDDSTIVIFLTDNGPQFYRYNGGMKGKKGSVHEGGVRVPMFMRWPGRISPGKKVEKIASHVDILPTLTAMCEITKYQTLPLDGKNLLPLIQDTTENWQDRRIYTFKFSRNDDRVVPGSVRTQRWRAVRGGKKGQNWELYDMKSDPGQKRNVAKNFPELLEELKDEYEKVSKEATKNGFDLPIHIGYNQWPRVILPAHEAYLEKTNGSGISYKGNAGWANDWITNWTDIHAYPWWNVKVIHQGFFNISIMYACSNENLGAKFRVEINDQTKDGIITQAHDPRPLYSPDRVKRGEVYEKTWANLKVGTLRLQPGKTKLILRAIKKPGKQMMDVKAVHVTKV